MWFGVLCIWGARGVQDESQQPVGKAVPKGAALQVFSQATRAVSAGLPPAEAEEPVSTPPVLWVTKPSPLPLGISVVRKQLK